MAVTAVVFAGGIGFGAYQGGAYEALAEAGRNVDWFLGASVGAVNAAIVAGNPPERRLERLKAFWESGFWPTSPAPALAWPPGAKWLSALQARLLGSPGRFTPNFFGFAGTNAYPGLYDLTPLRRSLAELIDYERLNDATIRFTLTATDVVSGEPVTFDTARGDRIGPDHLLAAAGFFPDFPMTEIDGRLLADGGYYANAPIEALKEAPELDAQDLTCFVVDLYAGDGYAPATLEQCFARRNELTFGNQTRRALAGWRAEQELRSALRKTSADAALSRHGPASVRVLHLAFRPDPKDASPLTPFDFSPVTLAERWDAGRRDMLAALAIPAAAAPPPFDLRAIPRQPPPPRG